MSRRIPTCQMDKLVSRRRRPISRNAEQVEVPRCYAQATRQMWAGSRRSYQLCLWHSLVATEHMGARLVAVMPASP
jgi:hypothetical protein